MNAIVCQSIWTELFHRILESYFCQKLNFVLVHFVVLNYSFQQNKISTVLLVFRHVLGCKLHSLWQSVLGWNTYSPPFSYYGTKAFRSFSRRIVKAVFVPHRLIIFVCTSRTLTTIVFFVLKFSFQTVSQ